MFGKYFLALCSLVALPCLATVDFNAPPAAFVLETKQIRIPGYPDAFNPSIVRWEGKLLMSFRNIANSKDSYNSSEVGLVWLDESFDPIAPAQIIPIESGLPFRRAEDARIIFVEDHLYMIYSNNVESVINKAGFRVYVAELQNEDGILKICSKERLEQFDGSEKGFREKNWTPFSYRGNLLLSYSLNPHIVFYPIFGTETCLTVAESESDIEWKWGELRGGTQTHLVDGQYLTFFHSSERILSPYSDNREMLHYYMGAASFDDAPPFKMTSISPKPIIGSDFFSGPIFKPYWGSWRGIFPGGFIFDDDFIYVFYGKQNHEVWVVKMDKKGLLESLVPVPR